MPVKRIPRSKSGASKSRPRWATHTRVGNVWEYPPPPPGHDSSVGRYVNAASRKSLEIQAYSILPRSTKGLFTGYKTKNPFEAKI